MTRGREATRFGRFTLAVVMLLAGIGIGAGVMVGAQSATMDYACVNSSGPIKMVSATTKCGNIEILAQWNQRSLPGAPGADGAGGLDGVHCWDLIANRVDEAAEDVNGGGPSMPWIAGAPRASRDCQAGPPTSPLRSGWRTSHARASASTM